MLLKEISFARVRNLCETSLNLGPGFNLLLGPNGSGKTAILESVALLCRGQSFRTPNIRSVIHYDQQTLRVTGTVLDEKRGRMNVTFTKNRQNEARVRLNFNELHRASELAQIMPLQVITADSPGMVLGGPKGRRRFLDWGIFHEQRLYLQWRKEYQRILRQRNSLLRARPTVGSDAQLEAWDQRLCEAGNKIVRSQKAYVQEINAHLRDMLSSMKRPPGGTKHINLTYYAGWSENDGDFMEIIRATRQRDVKLGRTVAGPQAADFRILVGTRNAGRVLSRGEAKSLAQVLHLAQAERFFQATGRRCLFLVDELASELDARARTEIMALLVSREYQVLAASAVEMDELMGTKALLETSKLFHVEQGRVTEEEPRN